MSTLDGPRVNAETRQRSTTSDLIFSCSQLVSHISRSLTLKPGDVIFTGTPEGVIASYPPGKQVWLTVRQSGGVPGGIVGGSGSLAPRPPTIVLERPWFWRRAVNRNRHISICYPWRKSCIECQAVAPFSSWPAPVRAPAC